MDINLLKSEYTKFTNSSNNEFLLFYSSFSDLSIFLSKIGKESDGQTLIICDTISKTNQIKKILEKYISKDSIAIINKTLSKTEIYSSYKNINSENIKIVIGTKTAIFSPFFNLQNIIIIDEESFFHKQYDQNPRYNVKDVANFLVNSNKNIKLIYTSTCPSIETYNKNLKILDITNNINNTNILFLEKNNEIISQKLEDKINDALDLNQKTIIINNNKLFATSIFCSDCGYIEKCDNCKIPLKLNKKTEKEECNICGANRDIITNCPKCNSINIKFLGTGNQKIYSDLEKRFPNKKILLIDKEKTSDIKEINSADIIIGTEFLTQNFLYYINNIYSLVLFSVDSYFQIPDFKSNELLYRYIKKSIDIAKEKNIENLIIKTKYIDNNILNLAINNEYKKFYNYEIKIREMLNYPPFSIIIKLIIKDKTEKEFIKKLSNTKAILDSNKNIEVIGENKIDKKNEVHIILKIKKENYNSIKSTLKEISKDALLDINPEFLIK